MRTQFSGARLIGASRAKKLYFGVKELTVHEVSRVTSLSRSATYRLMARLEASWPLVFARTQDEVMMLYVEDTDVSADARLMHECRRGYMHMIELMINEYPAHMHRMLHESGNDEG